MLFFNSSIIVKKRYFAYFLPPCTTHISGVTSRNRHGKDFVLHAMIGSDSLVVWPDVSVLAHRGGARGMPGGATAPPKFCLAPQWPPQNFPRDVMSLHWSPTQTIDSSPCCKTGPSSGPPKWKCLTPPLVLHIPCSMPHFYLECGKMFNAFVQRYRILDNVWICALMQSDCSNFLF